MRGWAVAAMVLCMGVGEAPGVVNIDNFSFGPAELVIERGMAVTWTNRDDIPHTVLGPAMRSAVLDTDDRFSFRFDAAGRFTYFCSLHPQMTGVVVVR